MSKRNINEDATRSGDLRELRLLVPDARLPAVRQRVAEASARLLPADERDAMDWIESVSEFDSGDAER